MLEPAQTKLSSVVNTTIPSDSKQVAERQRHPALVLSIIAIILIVLLTLGARNWILQTREDLGKRLQEVAILVKVDKDQLAANAAKLEEAGGRLAVVEARLKESAAQQQALESLYQSLLRNRDETALAEVEQIVGLAAQQIQLLGNVEGALIALQQAETRLGTTDRPGFAPLRKAIRRDIDRLKALPKVDLLQLALQLDEVVRELDSLPMISEAQPSDTAQSLTSDNQPTNVKGEPAANGGVVDEVLAKAWGWSKTLLLAAWADMRRLVTIREVSNPDALLIAPTQAYFVRENLRLRMLNARLALLSRQQPMLRNDLRDARTWFVRYFDVKSPRVKDAIKTIDNLIAAQVASELPNLADSVSALRLSRTPGAR